MRKSSVPQGIGIFPHAQVKFVGLNWQRMAVTVEMQNTGDPGLQREVAATIEHALEDRPGIGGFRLLAHRRMTDGK